jgi:cytochrome c biogenesis protein ResB
MALRFTRFYYPFQLTLLKATNEQYRGTDIPKNFASRVRVENPGRNEARETVIYMNNPLRYAGLTFFQYQMSAGQFAESRGVRPSSTFEVVRNPSWLTPYLACVMVAAGLIIQFMSHLLGFAKKRRTA